MLQYTTGSCKQHSRTSLLSLQCCCCCHKTVLPTIASKLLLCLVCCRVALSWLCSPAVGPQTGHSCVVPLPTHLHLYQHQALQDCLTALHL
jgi:hypothetical protein